MMLWGAVTVVNAVTNNLSVSVFVSVWLAVWLSVCLFLGFRCNVRFAASQLGCISPPLPDFPVVC